MQLKGIIKNLAVKAGVPANALLQNYMLERLLERISLSDYQHKFILKGGMLISSIVGIGSRTTMDMDATVKGIDFTKENLLSVFNEIIHIDASDDVTFFLKGIDEIREESEYGGYRLSFSAVYESINVPIKVDVSVGDVITPREIIYSFKLMFEDRPIQMPAYNLETILAEKFETIIRRGVLNTRARDFYDVYILTKLHIGKLSARDFKDALNATSTKRETIGIIADSKNVIKEVSADASMQFIWQAYTRKFDYAKDIPFDDTILALHVLYETYVS
jgi:predicted nucleotidyltransferase component of viral defense system